MRILLDLLCRGRIHPRQACGRDLSRYARRGRIIWYCDGLENDFRVNRFPLDMSVQIRPSAFYLSKLKKYDLKNI